MQGEQKTQVTMGRGHLDNLQLKGGWPTVLRIPLGIRTRISFELALCKPSESLRNPQRTAALLG